MQTGEIFLDGLIDSAKMLPWLFVTYLLIEVIERHVGFERHGKFLSGRAAPVFGSLAGAFPSCGVSVMSAKLYDGGFITVGTLFSVFIATSDEAFSILLASSKRMSLVWLLLIKIGLAVVIGEVIDLVIRRKPQAAENEDFKHEEVCAHCHDHVGEDETGRIAFANAIFSFRFFTLCKLFCSCSPLILFSEFSSARAGSSANRRLRTTLQATDISNLF